MTAMLRKPGSKQRLEEAGPPVVVRIRDAILVLNVLLLEGQLSLTAILLFQMFPDLRNNLKVVARRLACC